MIHLFIFMLQEWNMKVSESTNLNGQHWARKKQPQLNKKYTPAFHFNSNFQGTS